MTSNKEKKVNKNAMIRTNVRGIGSYEGILSTEGMNSCMTGRINHISDAGMVGYPLIISLTQKYPTRPTASSDIFVSTEYQGISDHPLAGYLINIK